MAENNYLTRLLETGEFRVSDDGHALLFGDYLFLLPPRVMIRLQELLIHDLGEERADEILRDIGSYQVHSALQRYEKRLNIGESSVDKIIDLGLKILSILGLGNVSIDERQEEMVRFTIKAPTIATEYKELKGETDRPIDSYLCGVFEEFCETVILRTDCTADEKTCVARGDDVCTIIVRPTG